MAGSHGFGRAVEVQGRMNVENGDATILGAHTLAGRVLADRKGECDWRSRRQRPLDDGRCVLVEHEAVASASEECWLVFYRVPPIQLVSGNSSTSHDQVGV